MNSIHTASSSCLCGVAQCDITPPIGMYHRMWGAATHDVSTGVHQPLMAYALALGDAAHEMDSVVGNALRVVVALDHCVLVGGTVEEILERIEGATELRRDQVHITLSHTHGAGFLHPSRYEMPGGHLIRPYLDGMLDKVVHIVRESLDGMKPARITYGSGRCSLASNRDFWDERLGQYVCGFNPSGVADDTVLVARATDSRGQIVATVVNYACHPTTLAWQNTLISPDFPGTMRAVVESATGAPCIFLQGASADLGPKEGFVGDVAVAERNGRQLGYAALATLEALPPPGTYFEYAGLIMSGTALGTWQHTALNTPMLARTRRWRSRNWHVQLPIRRDMITPAEARQRLLGWERDEAHARAAGDIIEAQKARARMEQCRRELDRSGLVEGLDTYSLPVSLWQIGDAFWVAVAAEESQYFQVQLRKLFPHMAVIVMTLTNSSLPTYLPAAQTYGCGLYQETTTVLAAGALEQLTDEVAAQLQTWQAKYDGQGIGPQGPLKEAPCTSACDISKEA
jgi:hypothetical protein